MGDRDVQRHVAVFARQGTRLLRRRRPATRYNVTSVVLFLHFFFQTCTVRFLFFSKLIWPFSNFSGSARTSLLGAGDGRPKRVVEEKVHHVPLKRRLKLSPHERTIIAGVTRTAETEMDRLNTHARTNYGATGGVYSAVPPSDAEAAEAAALERSIRRSTAQADAHRLDCCACLDSEWAHDKDLKSIFCAGKPIWYFR